MLPVSGEALDMKGSSLLKGIRAPLTQATLCSEESFENSETIPSSINTALAVVAVGSSVVQKYFVVPSS